MATQPVFRMTLSAVLLLLLLLSLAAPYTQGAEIASAYFNSAGFQGVVSFTQYTNATGSFLTIDATNLTIPAGQSGLSLNVYRLPVQLGRYPAVCAGSGEVFTTASGTQLGLLSGAGVLQTMQPVTIETDLSVTGPYGVAGRALAIVDVGRNTQLSCANIHLVSTESQDLCTSSVNQQTVYVATFSGLVTGTITFQQLSGYNATTLFSHLYYTNDAAAATTGHAWGAYRSLGSSNSASGCAYELGLLAANLSPHQAHRLPIATTPQDLAGRQQSSLRLTPSLSYLAANTIIAVHTNGDPTSPILACASIARLQARRLRADFTGTYSGTVRLAQASGQSATLISSNFTSSSGAQLRAVVNTYPGVKMSEASQCGSERLGGVFNPFSTQSATSGDANATPDTYPAGAIGSKLAYSAQGQVCDNSIRLWGRHGLANRSMTLLDSGNVPMQCTNIYDELEAGDRILFAKAVFTEGPVRGAIFISHVAYADGTNGETTLYSRGLTNYETYHATQVSRPTFGHSIHVHTGRVGPQTDEGACAGMYTGGHYNPHGVSVRAPRYGQECTVDYPVRCEVGDISRKTGSINLDGSPIFRNIPELPLRGPESVMRRSIVIHAANGGGSRIACANVIPIDAADVRLEVPSQEFSVTSFTDSMNAALSSAGMASTTVSVLDTYTTTGAQVIVRGILEGGDPARANEVLRSALTSRQCNPTTTMPNIITTSSSAKSVQISAYAGLIASMALIVLL